MSEDRKDPAERILIARAIRKVRNAHGAWMAKDPNTRELIAELVHSGIDQEDELVELVEISAMAGGKRYDKTTATFQ
ncbi:hypothetical protein [Rhizobium wuzhouense]|uniref:Uncharacterized protein n=1 Tax=Rhizobium wuzhouense TaxID=1986026 RepID=A0ABX5NZ48_9HYPH|nr:hypothetical protein [Rhizobium wuzhouense]PYB77674.1 hypothetical protein DMY87_04825 [Rhizobium wuzhouense]